MYVSDGALTIRNAEARDVGQLCRWWNDGEVMAHAGFPKGLGTTEEKIHADLSRDDDTHRRCIIELDGRPIGEMNYRVKGEGTAEIGIKICDKTARDRGLGTRLLSMFIGALFGEYGFERIVLDTNLNNLRAQHVYEKLGFRRVRVNFNSWENQLGEPQSSVDYALTREEFLSAGK